MKLTSLRLDRLNWRPAIVLGALPTMLIVAACSGQGQSTTAPKTSGTLPSAVTPATTGASPVAKAATTTSTAPTSTSPVAKTSGSPSPVARLVSPSPSPAVSARPAFTMTMKALNDSGQVGLATLTDLGSNRTRVVLDLKGSQPGPQPAHIHEGTCDSLNPAPKYPLTNLASGKSATEVPVALADIANGKYAINVHKSAQDIPTYFSCGNIPLMLNMRALNSSGQDGIALLTDLGGAKTQVMLDLRNSPAGPQPAHIHEGTCANLNATPKYPLTNVANGKSLTDVDVKLAELLAGKYAINAHKSAQEVSTYVSCADIAAPTPTPTVGTGGTGGTTGTATSGAGTASTPSTAPVGPSGSASTATSGTAGTGTSGITGTTGTAPRPAASPSPAR